MNEAFAVEINENIEHGFEHFAGFRGRERTLGENLGEVFFGILHHDVETIPVLKAAAADVEDAEQMGMSELGDAAPKGELEIGGGTGGNKFDGGFL
jgi:hypothetical protein